LPRAWGAVMTSLQEIMTWFGDLALHLPSIHIRDLIEIALIAFVIYQLLIWSRRTRAWVLFKGIVVLVLISVIASIFELNTILWIINNALNVGIIAIIIVFQPELRRALESLGRRNILNSIFTEDDREKFEGSESVINEIVDAVYIMAAVKTGALIVIEQHEKLSEYEGTGISIGAYVTREMLVNIFEHNTPLHDGAVIIRHNRIVAATCYLPLSDNMTLSKELGTRHRAGVGISEVSDAVVIIVSEENGKVSVAIGGNLVRDVESEYLKNKLLHIYSTATDQPKRFKLWRGRAKVDNENHE